MDIGASILQQLPMLLLNAGLQLVAVGAWPAGLALIAASGLVAIGAGAVSYAQGQASSGVTANALGGVYGSPSLSAYSNGVYNSPQMFAFAKGAGVFAEAGAEAIMPLERDASGRLGVSASGSGASVEVIINNMAPGTQVTQEERTGPDGTRQVVATVKSIVKSMGRDGELDGVMGRYGLSPQGVRR
jgi:lambda family phage tail tape measure protein